MTVDPKRTGVKAREVIDLPDRPDDQARYFGTPGDMVRINTFDGSLYGFNIACPGCGQFGVISIGAQRGVNWRVTGGTVEDVTTLSIMDSILKHCCGWHGFLKNGVFESC